MTSTIFDGRRTLWMFQYWGRTSPVKESLEQSIEEIAATALNVAGANIVLQKAMDGENFQAVFDRGTNAIQTLADWKQNVAKGKTAGVDVLPWVVPQNATQAASHAALGPEIVVDLEDDPTYFWNDRIDRIPTYLAGLRAGGVQHIHVSIDPRPIHRNYLNLPDWVSQVDSVLPQSYWTDFQTPALANVADIQALLALTPNVYPVLPYNGSQSDLVAFWSACLALGCKSPQLWRCGPANGTQLQNFAALSVPPAPPEVDPLAEALAKLDALLEDLHEIQRDAIDLSSRVTAALARFS